MPASLALSASVSATSDFIGSPTGNFLIGAQLCDGVSTEVEPATSVHVLGSALRALGPADFVHSGLLLPIVILSCQGRLKAIQLAR